MQSREERENQRFLWRLIVCTIVLLICTVRILEIIGII
jgi:hypothetical protein|nr:MAG TPA: hypothetical protein [Bacteriophage sp.]